MKRVDLFSIIMGIILAIGIAVTLLPIIVVLISGFKLPRDIISGHLGFVPTLYNLRDVFGNYSFARLILNSVIASTGTTILNIIVASLAAYSLSRFKWPRAFTASILAVLLLIQMLPPVVFAGPFYVIARNIGIYDTPLALIMAYIVLQLPLSVLILNRFFADIPREMMEAASIDGAGNTRTFWNIAWPLAAPGVATAALLTFVFSWNDFLFALTLTSTPNGMTIPVGIASFSQDFQVLYGDISASASIATIPAVLMVIFAQRYVTRGLTVGAVKG